MLFTKLAGHIILVAVVSVDEPKGAYTPIMSSRSMFMLTKSARFLSFPPSLRLPVRFAVNTIPSFIFATRTAGSENHRLTKIRMLRLRQHRLSAG